MILADSFKKFMPLDSDNTLLVGEFRLLDNPSFCTDFLSFSAKKSQLFPSYSQWVNFLSKSYKTPEKPNKDNPYIYKEKKLRYSSKTKAVVYRTYVYLQKLEKYQKELLEIQSKKDKQAKVTNKYSLDERGYCEYVYSLVSDENKAFLDQFQNFYINSSEREKHTYLSGGSGSGKSEFLKILLHHYIKQDTPNQECIILIDPHSKISKEVAQFKENIESDRLVIIEATKREGKSATLNPLSTHENNFTSQSIDILAQELTGAFKEILQDSGFSPQMETLIKPCLSTLLLLPHSNLYHLQQMMNDEKNEELLLFSQKNLQNPAQRNFLAHDFKKKIYSTSKQSITTKLQSLLNSQIFIDFTIGESTLILKEAIEQKKIILFNLSRQSGLETSDTIGRLLLSSLQAIAMQRDHNNNSPIHLFIDECQHYITPSIESILTEARKYKLYLTLANQFDSQITNKVIRNAIQGNTNIKITARQTEENTLQEIKKSMGVSRSIISNLNIGEYFVKVGNYKGVIVKTNDSLVNDNNAMSPKQWEAIEKKQLDTYYKKKNDDFLFSSPIFKDKKKNRKRGLN